MQSPVQYRGGKRLIAREVLRRFGKLASFIDPFCGSLAILLSTRDPIAKREIVNDLDCVAPETRILMSDLSWSAAGDVKVGDVVLGFDEQNGEAREGFRPPKRYRRLALGKVLAVRRLRKPCYRLTFDDGTSVVASSDHMWLSGSHVTGSTGRGWRWVKTASMTCGKLNRSWVLKVCDVVDREESWQAGWIGGMLDGEGNIRVGPGTMVCLTQNKGAVLKTAERLIRARGFDIRRRIPKGRKVRRLELTGGLAATLAFLMRFRPQRLIANLQNRLSNVSLYGRTHRAVGLVSKEFLGVREVVAIQTDCHTFIAEGLASHNCLVCNFWRAIVVAPEAVAKYAMCPKIELDFRLRREWLFSNKRSVRKLMLSDPAACDVQIAGWWVWQQNIEFRASDPSVRLTGKRGLEIFSNPDEILKKCQERLRSTVVLCRTWEKILSDERTLFHGGTPTGVFLDPPYLASTGRKKGLYRTDSGDVANAAREWAIAHGDDSRLRIALCGLEGEHVMPDTWDKYAWSPGASKSSDKERVWFSPFCSGRFRSLV